MWAVVLFLELKKIETTLCDKIVSQVTLLRTWFSPEISSLQFISYKIYSATPISQEALHVQRTTKYATIPSPGLLLWTFSILFPDSKYVLIWVQLNIFVFLHQLESPWLSLSFQPIFTQKKKHVVTLTQENNHGICLAYVAWNEKQNAILWAKYGVNNLLYREITVTDVVISLIQAHETNFF